MVLVLFIYFIYLFILKFYFVFKLYIIVLVFPNIKMNQEDKRILTMPWDSLIGMNPEFGVNMYTLLYIKEITNKDLLYSIGNYIQYLVITYNGKESEKNTHTHIKN